MGGFGPDAGLGVVVPVGQQADDELVEAYEETLRRLQEGMTASWSRSIGPAITRAERMV